jgi:hypothetical protein
MADPTGFLNLTFHDFDGEASNTRLRTAALTDVNIVAQEALVDALITAIEDVCIGLTAKRQHGNEQKLGIGSAATGGAQREMKWLVQYYDPTTLKQYTSEIPCPNVARLDVNDRAHADIGDAAEVDAFVDAFQAVVLTPDGNQPAITEITLVGRNV